MSRPVAVGVWVLAGLAVALTGTDPWPPAIVLAASLTLLARRRLSDHRLGPLMVGLVVLGGLTVVSNGLLDHTGATNLFTVPSWIPVLGGTVTAEGFAEGADIAVRLVAAVSATSCLCLVLEPTDLVDALPGPLRHSATMLGSALNLVPATAASFVAIRDSQRLRGWKPTGPRAMVDLVVPVMLGAIERSVQLAESMDARAFGTAARTTAFPSERDRRCTFTVALAGLALAGLVAGSVSGLADLAWYPYPTPGVPSPAPAATGPALLVLLAAVLIPRAEPGSEEPGPDEPGLAVVGSGS